MFDTRSLVQKKTKVPGPVSVVQVLNGMSPPRLRLGTVNVNGALYSPERLTTTTIAHLMDRADISVLGITDARVSQALVESLQTSLRLSLPQGTAIIVFPTLKPYSDSHRNTTMGGQVFLINRQLEKWVGHHRSDASGLSLVTSIRITFNRSALTIIQVMVPPQSSGPHTMWQRLLHFLTTTNNPLMPDAYVIQTTERWAAADKLAGRAVAIMGDFNRSTASLASWAAINDMSSLSPQLATAGPGHGFASFNGTSSVKPSLIDRIFLQRKTSFALTSVGGLMNPLFTLVSDHNPS